MFEHGGEALTTLVNDQIFKEQLSKKLLLKVSGRKGHLTFCYKFRKFQKKFQNFLSIPKTLERVNTIKKSTSAPQEENSLEHKGRLGQLLPPGFFSAFPPE